MITDSIYLKFISVKSSLTPGKIVGNFKLTEDGVYLYKHPGSHAEIIGFSSEEAEKAYEAKCEEIYNQHFNNKQMCAEGML